MPDKNDTPQARIELGRRIMLARLLVEPNRRAFARKLKVDVATIRNIEMGTRNASIWLLQRICRALRIDLDYVVEGRLSGVDRELRQMLVDQHPWLARRWLKEQAAQQQAPALPDSERKNNPGSRLALPS